MPLVLGSQRCSDEPMIPQDVVDSIRSKYQSISPLLDERSRRVWAATEAISLGQGGINALARATGLTRKTISKGIAQVQGQDETSKELDNTTIRRKGGGRKRLKETSPGLLEALEALVDPATRGDPERPLIWTSKSTRKLARELKEQGFKVSIQTVARLLHELGFSLQANRKTKEGKNHPDRDAQFEYINRRVIEYQGRGEPVVSVDAKKKELVGEYYNDGREWRPKGSPEEVNAHDFPDKLLGKAIPYGVYDLTRNEGWVSVGIDHDTAPFATAAIKRWWEEMGSGEYPQCRGILITADSGGSNSVRGRLWKVSLQKLSDELGLHIMVCHFPPGTSKWNKIEHRMFCHVTQNWRGRPLVSHEVILNLLEGTTTRIGLRIRAEIDPGKYERGIKVGDEELASVQILRSKFHGDWNYMILPRLQYQ